MRFLVLGVIFLLYIIEQSNQRPIGVKSDYSEETDLLVDAALQMVRGFLKKNQLDPMKLPDIHFHTTTKILGINVNVYFDATSLVLNGLSTLRKTDYLQVSLQPNNIVNIRAIIQVSDVSVVGKAKIKAGVFGSDVASIHIERLTVLAELDLPKDDSSKPRATKFEIQEIGKITIDRGHSGTISGWLDSAASFVVNKFRDTMKREIAPLILENLNEALLTLTTVMF